MTQIRSSLVSQEQWSWVSDLSQRQQLYVVLSSSFNFCISSDLWVVLFLLISYNQDLHSLIVGCRVKFKSKEFVDLGVMSAFDENPFAVSYPWLELNIVDCKVNIDYDQKDSIFIDDRIDSLKEPL